MYGVAVMTRAAMLAVVVSGRVPLSCFMVWLRSLAMVPTLVRQRAKLSSVSMKLFGRLEELMQCQNY